MRRALATAVVVLGLVGLTHDGWQQTTQVRDVALGNGLLSGPSEAKAWVDRQGGGTDPAVVRRIAEQPDAFWLVGSDGDAGALELIDLARQQDRTVQLVLYDVPRRDDGLSGAQGAADLEAYAAWVDQVSAAIGDTRAVVVVEPDALWFVDRQTPDGAARTERIESLRYAVRTLGERNPRTRVYVEAGTSSGSVETDRMADLLAEVGVSDDVGFAVNVSSYAPDAEINAYAQEIRARLVAAHGLRDPRYVVDTGRNGNPDWDFEWCNPSGRQLGHEPGPVGDDAGLDLNLWIKAPATSDGDCGVGRGTYGGEFMPDEAIRMSHGRS
ncbi:glycoside hydrolase family 6 protein [Aeromicrobium fastidiosum]|nr:glycoside hydrolase family 6 protein [Aeromicrobium fastidiosum]MBP2390929.1 endoglucanase [Aeromicrobium fastidiosum]